MEEAYAYIDKANKTSATFSGLFRNDTRDYPSEALREALLNSFCHRDYEGQASTKEKIDSLGMMKMRTLSEKILGS